MALGAAAALSAAAGAALGPIPSQAQDAESPLQLTIEDFEAAPLGRTPYLWKTAAKNALGSEVGAEVVREDGVRKGKRLNFKYSFGKTASGNDYLSAGPGRRPLPGNLQAIVTTLTGDGAGNTFFLRLRDRTGERFDYGGRVSWTGPKRIRLRLMPPPKGSVGGNRNGKLDLPLTFDRVGVRRASGGKRMGTLGVGPLLAEVKFPQVQTLYDAAKSLDQGAWRAVGRNATVNEIGNQIQKYRGEDRPVLRLGYSYQAEGDASVEFRRTLTAGAGHGTFLLDVFGDGSNNILRVRAEDGTGRVFQANIPSILVDWAGWKTIYLDTRTLRDPNAVDPDEVMSKFPVKFHSLVVDDVSGRDQLPGVESGRTGELFLGRIAFAGEK